MEPHGRHSGQGHTHTVEGTDPQLHVKRTRPQGADAFALRPVLLIHGFASSTKLNWADAGWFRALTDAGRRVIAVDLPGPRPKRGAGGYGFLHAQPDPR